MAKDFAMTRDEDNGGSGLGGDAAPATVPMEAQAFDDYSIFVNPAPGDRFGLEFRVRLYRADALGGKPEPDGQRVRLARNGILAVYEPRYVQASEIPAPLERRPGQVFHD